jgi:pyruvate dehydrogenase E1 component beta subunit
MLWDEKIVVANAEQHNETVDKGSRVISYVDALREALDYKMQEDESVFMLGQGVDDPGGMFGVTKDFHKKYGNDRSFDTPVSEEGMTGICTGAALCGMRPVYFHNRPDFLLLAFNQIVNHASKLHWMDNGINNVPLTIWAAIGRGWGSGPQHSQAIHGLLMGVPGLKMIMPSTPYDAKGLMISAIEDNNPTIIIEHRWLTRFEGPVPEENYRVPIGKGVCRREGKDLTIVGVSHAIQLAEDAANQLAEESGIDAEVIDLRTIQPLDQEIILNSLAKTGKLLVVDVGWTIGGLSAEIASIAAEKGFASLKAPVMRVGLPDCPPPAGFALEQAFYPNVNTMKQAIIELHAK